MKLCLKIFAIAIVAAFTYSMIGCAAPAGYSYSNVSISLIATCSDCPGVSFNPAYPLPSSAQAAVTSSVIPAGAVIMVVKGASAAGVVNFTANVTNAPANVTWTIYPTANLTGITVLPTGTTTPVSESGDLTGTITQQSGNLASSGSTIDYGTPNGVPIYSGAALVQAQAMGIPQGDVLLQVSVPNNPSNPSSVTTFNQLIQIYNTTGTPSTYLTPSTPTTPAGLTNPVVTVARNTSYAFYGGSAGAGPCTTPSACAAISSTAPPYSPDDGTVWAVGPALDSVSTAVVGGNATWGNISTTGVYTAPATIPATSTGTAIAGEVVVYAFTHSSCAAGACSLGAYAYVGID